MGRAGLELSQFHSGNSGVLETGGSKSGNIGAGFDPPTPPEHTDPDLARVVAAWPDLPPAIRAGVVALVAAAAPAKPAGGEGGR